MFGLVDFINPGNIVLSLYVNYYRFYKLIEYVLGHAPPKNGVQMVVQKVLQISREKNT